ncbi:MAG: hypothetical protein JNL75_08775 [Chitinophagales bacterium]|nr:hypothetical protein [Chitinophagales bacterium]
MLNKIPLLFIMILIVFASYNISSCDKEPASPWFSCINKFTKDNNFRMGVWKRTDASGTINPQGFNFKNDSIMDILENINPDVWKYNIKYRMKSCDSFQMNKYWIQPQDPKVEYWYTYISKFNETKEEVELYFLRNWDRDTIRLKKQ